MRQDGSPVLLDFGSARQALGSQTKTLTSPVSPGYAPFEQYVSKSDQQGPWTDIYGLGATLYRGICGRSPQDAMDRSAAIHQSSADVFVPATEIGKDTYSHRFLAAINASLQFKPEDRPQTIAEWRDMFGVEAALPEKTTKPEPSFEEKKTQVAPEVREIPITEKKHRAPFIALLAVLIVGADAGFWWLQKQRIVEEGAVVPDAGVEVTVEDAVAEPADALAQKIQALLTVAEGYFNEGKLTGDAQGNALSRYRAVLLLDPGNQAAKTGITHVATAYIDEAVAAIKANEFDAAENYLAQTQSITPDHPELPTVRKRLADAKAAAETKQGLDALYASALEDIDALRLTSPPYKNALAKADAIAEQSPGDQRAAEIKQRVVTKYVELADRALSAGDLELAGQRRDKARAILPDAEPVVALTTRIDAALTQRSQTEIAAAVRAVEGAIAQGDADTAATLLDAAVSAGADPQTLQTLGEAIEALRQRQPPVLAELGIEMVDIPGGSFRMGDLSGAGDASEKPVHTVKVKPFRMSRHEVTFRAWDACVAAGGCSHRPSDEGWGRGKRPVINVSWDDAQAFVRWLNGETGSRFRLPSEAEWEYAARAGTTTEYSWGDMASHEHANYGTDECCEGYASGRDRWVNTAPVGSFAANAFGLHDMHGNVYEWTEDCWHASYAGAPADGSAWTQGRDCGLRVKRGGSWHFSPWLVRSANRTWTSTVNRNNYLGFRLSQDR